MKYYIVGKNIQTIQSGFSGYLSEPFSMKSFVNTSSSTQSKVICYFPNEDKLIAFKEKKQALEYAGMLRELNYGVLSQNVPIFEIEMKESRNPQQIKSSDDSVKSTDYILSQLEGYHLNKDDIKKISDIHFYSKNEEYKANGISLESFTFFYKKNNKTDEIQYPIDTLIDYVNNKINCLMPSKNQTSISSDLIEKIGVTLSALDRATNHFADSQQASANAFFLGQYKQGKSIEDALSEKDLVNQFINEIKNNNTDTDKKTDEKSDSISHEKKI